MTFPKTLTVTVTAEHIKHGTQGDCGVCPVALAIREHFPKHSLNVFWERAFINAGPFEFIIYNFPSEVKRFIEEFDTYRHGEPFTFEAMLEESL